MSDQKANKIPSISTIALAASTAFSPIVANAQTDDEKADRILRQITQVYNGGQIDPNGPEFQVRVSSDPLAQREFPKGRCVNVNVETMQQMTVNGTLQAVPTIAYIAQFNYESENTLGSMSPGNIAKLNEGVNNLSVNTGEIEFWLRHVRGHGVKDQEIFDPFRFARGYQGFDTPVTIDMVDPNIIQDEPWEPDPNAQTIEGVASQFLGIECD